MAEYELPKPLLDHLRQTSTDRMSFGKAGQILRSMEDEVKHDRMTLTAHPTIYHSNMYSMNMSSIDQDERLKSMTNSNYIGNSITKEKSNNNILVNDSNSRDISYFNEKKTKPNKLQTDREYMRDFFSDDNQQFELPTQMHQLEEQFKTYYMDDNQSVFKGLMKPTKEKDRIRNIEEQVRRDSYESDNQNMGKPVLTTMTSEDINFDSINKTDLTTPKQISKPTTHKVSFNEGISEINERSDTKYDNKSIIDTNKSTGLRQIVQTINEDDHLENVQEEQYMPQDIKKEMNKVDETMDIMTINDHLNRKQQDLNQTYKTLTSPRNIIKSQSESAFNHLSQFGKQLDGKINNKGTEVKVFGQKIPEFERDDIKLIQNVGDVNDITNLTDNKKMDAILVNESRYNQDPSLKNYVTQTHGFGAPTKRKDAQKLNAWLEFMLQKYVNNSEMSKFSDDFRIKSSQLVQSICLKELIRQVSANCLERGLLLDKIWNSNITLFTVCEEVYQVECQNIKNEFNQNMLDAECEFKKEMDLMTEKVNGVKQNLADKDFELMKKQTSIDQLTEDLDNEKKRTDFLNGEVNKIVDYFNKQGKLPPEQMGEANEIAKREQEQAEEDERQRQAEEQAKLEAEEREKAEQKDLFKDIDGPKIAKRKIILPNRPLNELDHKCRAMSIEELIAILDDPNADESLKHAALRALVSVYGVEMLEDENGNKILIDKDGNPLLNKDGKPIKITAQFLKDMGASLGKAEKIDMDMEKLKLLSKMVLGQSAEEAARALINDEMGNALDDFLANCDISIDSCEGPLPGTRNKGLCTIKIPEGLLDASKFSNEKVFVDAMQYELLMALSAQYLYENEKQAEMIADYTYKKFGSVDDWIEQEEEIEEIQLDQYGDDVIKKRTVKKRKYKTDYLEYLRQYLLDNGQPLKIALDNFDPNADDPDMANAAETWVEYDEHGRPIKVIRTLSGRIIKKVMTEDEAELYRMKEANKLNVDFSGEENAIKNAENAINAEKEALRELEKQREMLSVKEEFKIPGVNGRLVRRVLNSSGGEEWIAIDLEHEDIDDTMSIQEETIEDGQTVRTKLTKEKIKELIAYKIAQQLRDQKRLEKLAAINKEINEKVEKIKEQEAKVAAQKAELAQKKKEAQELVKAVQEGKLNPDDMFETKLRDGIRKVIGKDGKVKQFDKDGNEISEDQAFEKVKKTNAQMKRDQEEKEGNGYTIDPKTGKRVPNRKPGEEEDEYEVDPKTGKMIKKIKGKTIIEEEIDPKTGKKVKVEYEEFVDEYGNVVRRRKDGKDGKGGKGGKNKQGFGDGDYDEKEEQYTDEFGNKIKIKKKTLNAQGLDKLGNNLGGGNGGRGGKGGKGSIPTTNKPGKVTYIDEYGNIVEVDEKDYSKFERPPYTTQMVTLRLTRVQNELNKLDDRKHFKFSRGDKAEDACRDEMEKLCNLIANILGKKSFGNNASDHIKACDDVGKDRSGNNKDGTGDKDGKNSMNRTDPDLRSRLQDVVLELPTIQCTEFDEFNIGKRARRLRPLHMVYKFIEQMQSLMKQPKFVVKMFMPKKKLFLTLEQTYDEYLFDDANLKTLPCEMIQDSYLKKFGLKKLAENKLKDFLVTCMAVKLTSRRCLDFLDLFQVGNSHSITSFDEQQVQVEAQKWLKQYAQKINKLDVDSQLDKWNVKVISAISAFESHWMGVVGKQHLDELKNQLMLRSEQDASYSGEFLGSSEISQAFKTRFAPFISDFTIPMYRELKLSQMTKVDEICRSKKISVPDLMDKKCFCDLLVSLFNEPNGAVYFGRYRQEGEQVSLDLFQQIVTRHNLLRQQPYSEKERNVCNESLMNFLVNVQGSDDLIANTFTGQLRALSNDDLKNMHNEHSLRAFSDLMLDKFDSQKRGILDLDEFVNLCAWIDPKWERINCIKRFNEIDADRNRFADRNEFWQFARTTLTVIIEDYCKTIRI